MILVLIVREELCLFSLRFSSSTLDTDIQVVEVVLNWYFSTLTSAHNMFLNSLNWRSSRNRSWEELRLNALHNFLLHNLCSFLGVHCWSVSFLREHYGWRGRSSWFGLHEDSGRRETRYILSGLEPGKKAIFAECDVNTRWPHSRVWRPPLACSNFRSLRIG